MDDANYQINLLTAMNEKLMSSEHIYRLACENSGKYFIYYDLKNENRAELIGDWDTLTGEKLSRQPYDEKYMLSFVFDDDQKMISDTLLSMEKSHKDEVTAEFRSKDGRKWFKALAKVNYDRHNHPVEKIICIDNITKSKKESEETEYFAYYDSLTGLYNRNCFVVKLRDMLEKADKCNESVELLFVDIDNFKKINDSLGLVYGDELVQDFGLYLKEFQSENVVVSRYGSDVFCIAIYSPCGHRSADMLFKTIRERLKKPFVLTNKASIEISVSAGCTEYPGCGNNAIELIRNTEIVLYTTKEKEKGTISYFDENVLKKYLRDIEIENKLKVAIENNDFVVFFQPLFDIESNKIRGAEALIRWIDKDRKSFVCSPAEFIPIAEKNGSIVKLGNFVLEEVFRSIHEWKVKYKAEMIISINISVVQLLKNDFIDDLLKLVDKYEINTELIELEITETAMLSNFSLVSKKMEALVQLGFRIALDDFGTGYSSLTYLKDCSVNTLKIDKSFIDKVSNDEKTEIIIDSIIKMVNKLNIDTVAEGVESKVQFNFLKDAGCNNIQGFLLSKPVSKNDFEKIIIRQMP